MGEEREKGWNYREFSRAASRKTPSKIVESVLKPPLHRTSGQPSNEFHVHTLFRPVCVCMCVCASCAMCVRKREAG